MIHRFCWSLLSAIVYLSAASAEATPEVILPGDVVAVVAGDGSADRLAVFSAHLAPRDVPDDLLMGLEVRGISVGASDAQLYVLSDRDGGTIFAFNREFRKIFDGTARKWRDQDYLQAVSGPGAIYIASGRNDGQLVRMSPQLHQVKWGGGNLKARRVAVSPEGTHVFVLSDEANGTLYRVPGSLADAERIGGPAAGVKDLQGSDILALSEDRVAVLSRRDGGSVLLFTGDLKQADIEPGSAISNVRALSIAADGEQLLVADGGDGGRVVRFDSEGNELNRSVAIPGLKQVAVNPMGGQVVAWVSKRGGDDELVLLSADLQAVKARQPVDGRVKHLAIAPRPPTPLSVTPHPEWRNELKPAGEPAGQLELVGDVSALVDLVIPAEPTPQEEKASVDLAHWLYAATGFRVPVLLDTDDAVGKRPFVSVGETRQALEVAKSDRSRPLEPEAYSVVWHDGNIYLQGGSRRGPIYAVYALLEEDLGFRWYDRRSVVLPKSHGALTLDVVERTVDPPLERRDPHYTDAFNTDWSVQNRTDSPRAPVPAAWGGYAHTVPTFVHTYRALLPPAEFFEPHPEWFALLNGERKPKQLCPSHPGGQAKIIERVHAMLEAAPHARYVDVSPNDYPDYCQCNLCEPLIKREGTAMAPLLALTNAVAESLEKKHPEVLVTTLAYLTTVEPPKRLRPHRNVRVVYATNNHWSTICRPVTDNQVVMDHVGAWRRIKTPLHIWHYPIQYGQYVRPIPNMEVMSDDLRYFVHSGATGFMYQGNHSHSLGVDRAIQRCWVWSKQMWDPGRDPEALIRDFTLGYYGSAAEPMLGYHDFLWKLATRFRNTPYFQEPWKNAQPIFNPEFVQEAMPYLDQALAKAEDSGDETLVARVRLARLPVLYVKAELGPESDVAEYLATVDEIEKTAKANGVRFLKKGLAASPDRDTMITTWRNLAVVDPTKLAFQPLDAAWKLKSDPRDVGMRRGWAKPDHSETDWLDVEVKQGSFWERTELGAYDGHGWYRQTLTLPADLTRYEHLYLLFGGADEYAEVFLNGELVFDHSYAATLLPPDAAWNTPFAVDLKERVKPGQRYTLAVRIHDSEAAGGLWRPVWWVGSDQSLPADTLLTFIEKSGTSNE